MQLVGNDVIISSSRVSVSKTLREQELGEKAISSGYSDNEWKLSTVQKVRTGVDHTGSAVLRKPGSGTGKPATASACAVCRCKTIFPFVGFKTSVKFNVSKTLIIKRNKFCRTRSLSNATFSFLITWRSSSSKSAAVYKISLKADDFSLRYGDIMIFKMAAVRHLGIVLPPYETTHEVCCWPQLPDKFHVNLIHTSEDISIWIFRIFGLKCLLRPLKWGFWGNLDP